MKKLYLSLLCIVAATFSLSAQQKAEVKANGTTTQVTFYTPDIVRVVKYPSDAQGPTRESMVVTLTPQTDLKVQVKDSGSKKKTTK